MPVFVGAHHYPKMGSYRAIFVVDGDGADDQLARVMGENYDTIVPSMTLGLDRGSLWNGHDPTDKGSKLDRDVLLRLAKAGFTAREVTDDELRANAGAEGSSSPGEKPAP